MALAVVPSQPVPGFGGGPGGNEAGALCRRRDGRWERRIAGVRARKTGPPPTIVTQWPLLLPRTAVGKAAKAGGGLTVAPPPLPPLMVAPATITAAAEPSVTAKLEVATRNIASDGSPNTSLVPSGYAVTAYGPKRIPSPQHVTASRGERKAAPRAVMMSALPFSRRCDLL